MQKVEILEILKKIIIISTKPDINKGASVITENLDDGKRRNTRGKALSKARKEPDERGSLMKNGKKEGQEEAEEEYQTRYHHYQENRRN